MSRIPPSHKRIVVLAVKAATQRHKAGDDVGAVDTIIAALKDIDARTIPKGGRRVHDTDTTTRS